jgi:single stranded DNA-binding protein
MTSATDLIAAIIRSAQFTITGRIARDPEPRFFQSGSCKLQLNLAVNRPGSKKGDPEAPPPDWFKAEFWNDDAQAASDELRKGDLVTVTGRISSESWTTRDGEKRTDLVVKVEQWCPVNTGGNPAPAPAAPAGPAPLPLQQQAPAPAFQSDDKIPF